MPTASSSPLTRVPNQGQAPLFIVVGPAGHGKTTARKILEHVTDLPGASCSDVIYQILAHRRGIPVSQLRLESKEKLRPALIELGDYLTGSIGKLEEKPANPTFSDDILYRSPSALVRSLLLNGVRVIDGVRRKLELKDTLEKAEWLGIMSTVFYVSMKNGPKIEDNTEDLAPMADYKIANDGTEEDLFKAIMDALNQRFETVSETHSPEQNEKVEAQPDICLTAPESVLRNGKDVVA